MQFICNLEFRIHVLHFYLFLEKIFLQHLIFTPEIEKRPTKIQIHLINFENSISFTIIWDLSYYPWTNSPCIIQTQDHMNKVF